jgi:hypothetical protein
MEPFLDYWKSQGFSAKESSSFPGEYVLSKAGFHSVMATVINGHVCVFFMDGMLMGVIRNEGKFF